MSEKLPTPAAVGQCTDVITNSDAAEYFVAALVGKLKKAGMANNFSDLIKDAEQFADFIRQQATTQGDPWAGKFIERTSFQSYQDALAQDAAKMFTDQTISFDFAISDKAEILRGYSSEGTALSDEESRALDKLFNAWLAEKGMISRNSIIYEATSDGKVKGSERGEEIRADSEKVRQLILDKDEGVSKYVKNKNNATVISAIPHDYTDKKSEQSQDSPTQEKQIPG